MYSLITHEGIYYLPRLLLIQVGDWQNERLIAEYQPTAIIHSTKGELLHLQTHLNFKPNPSFGNCIPLNHAFLALSLNDHPPTTCNPLPEGTLVYSWILNGNPGLRQIELGRYYRKPAKLTHGDNELEEVSTAFHYNSPLSDKYYNCFSYLELAYNQPSLTTITQL